MDKKDMERDVLNNLESVLQGKEIEPGLNEDSRSALDFARRMLSLRMSPSPLFHDTLRNRLLQKIEKKEREAEHEMEGSFWERLWENWKQPVWRTVTVGLVSALVIVVIMGYSGVFTYFTPKLLDEEPPIPETAQAPEPEPGPVPGPAPTPGITIPVEGDAVLDKDVYMPGEEIVINLSFKNGTDGSLELKPFPPEIRIMRSYPYDEAARTFSAGERSKSLEPGEIASYTLTWDQLDDRGEQVPHGRYYLEFGRVRLEEGWTSISRHRYVSFLILPEEGTIEKTIEVNASKMVNGITITLERVEITTTEARFYAFNVPPDYDLPQGPNLPPPPLMSLHADAEYTLDGKRTIEAGLSGIHFLSNGMLHTWDMLDPVPKGTEELTFTITRLGDYEGPWEFQISLE